MTITQLPRHSVLPTDAPSPEPTAEQLLAALERADRHSEEAERLRAEIIEHYRPQIAREVRTYRNRGVSDEELRQVAVVGVLKAIRRYDPAHGKAFLSYLLPTMAGEIKRHFRDNTWAVRAPRRHQERRSELNRFTTDFAQAHNRAPTLVEIGAEFGLDPHATGDLLNACSAYSALSLDRPCGTEEDGIETTLGETIHSTDSDLELVPDLQALKKELGRLPSRERRIVILRYFGEMTQAEIAERMGCSQMHISRLLSATLAQLHRRLVSPPIFLQLTSSPPDPLA